VPEKKVAFFFAFASPFAALASFRVDDLVGECGAVLDPVAIVPPPAEPLTGLAAQLQEFKLEYLHEDAARWARRLHIPWKEPARGRVDATDATAGYLFARTKGVERDYRNAVFRARWCEGKDIADQKVLIECAEDCRLSTNEFLQALRSQQYHEGLSAALARCLEERVFGVPMFVVNGKRFWGNDRLDFLVEELKRS